MSAPLLNSKSLGNVSNIHMDKNANIEPIPISKKDSNLTKLFDFNGATKTITVTGSFTGINVAAVKSLIDAIELELDGYQENTIIFSSDMTASINVMVQSFNWDWDVNISEVAINYTLSLMQGVRGGQ